MGSKSGANIRKAGSGRACCGEGEERRRGDIKGRIKDRTVGEKIKRIFLQFSSIFYTFLKRYIN